MRPVGNTPHNLDATGSRSVYRARLLLRAVINVEPFFESSAHLMQSFAVWVI